ncbi:hypothetical protein [Vibrio cholerae]|uniref:hypothetical protein n=1 Tax=Vibrio cholerae TaxID=666 RepID=UPI00308016D4
MVCCRHLGVIIVLWYAASQPVLACSYDGQFNNPFAESYPGSLDVALATREAIISKKINRPQKLSGVQGFARAQWWLSLLNRKWPAELDEISYIYLVDSQLWSQRQSGQFKIHVPAPDETQRVLLLSETALAALVENEISFEQANAMKIIIATE